MNIGAPGSALGQAGARVLEIQTKLHGWARDDRHEKFDDLFNLVADPAFLLVAWERVRGNSGARTAGVDGVTAASVVASVGVEVFPRRAAVLIAGRQSPAVTGAGTDDPEVGWQGAPAGDRCHF